MQVITHQRPITVDPSYPSLSPSLDIFSKISNSQDKFNLRFGLFNNEEKEAHSLLEAAKGAFEAHYIQNPEEFAQRIEELTGKKTTILKSRRDAGDAIIINIGGQFNIKYFLDIWRTCKANYEDPQNMEKLNKIPTVTHVYETALKEIQDLPYRFVIYKHVNGINAATLLQQNSQDIDKCVEILFGIFNDVVVKLNQNGFEIDLWGVDDILWDLDNQRYVLTDWDQPTPTPVGKDPTAVEKDRVFNLRHLELKCLERQLIEHEIRS